jgi:predicted metal-dependent phosphoesterase TrpH
MQKQNGLRHGTADLHVHTNLSDGRDTPHAVYATARERGLDVIAITDHDTLIGALIAADASRRAAAPPSVIVGEEVTSAQGHIIGLFLRELVRPGMSAADTIRAIQAQGGLAIAPHPFWRTLAAEGSTPHGVGALVFDLPFDALEVRNGGFTPSMMRANRRATAAAQVLGATAVGGSDAHVRQAVGWAHTRFPGRTPDELRRAIATGTTAAGALVLNPAGVVRYAARGLLRPAYSGPIT